MKRLAAYLNIFNSRSTTVFLLIFIIIGQCVYLLYPRSSSPLSHTKSNAQIARVNSADTGAQSEVWKEKIARSGGEGAYKELKETHLKSPYGIAHNEAHVFGAALYDSMGVSGVSVCDSTFAFGCYHSFFGKAISVEGVDIITTLDRECTKKWGPKGLGCAHGIGHGLLSSLGEEKLADSLTLCKRLSWQEPIGGCTSGVFMEYNFRTMENPDNVSMRALDEANPHYPCTEVTERFLEACYFEQPQWWEKVMNHDYERIGSLCDALDKPKVKEACFRGMGNTIGPSTQYDPKKTIAGCLKIRAQDGQMFCRQGAAWSFYAEPKVRQLAVEVCQGMSAEAIKICHSGADIFKDNPPEFQN